MKNLLHFFRNLVKNEQGQTMTEYGLILALIAVVVMVVLEILGTSLVAIINQVIAAL